MPAPQQESLESKDSWERRSVKEWTGSQGMRRLHWPAPQKAELSDTRRLEDPGDRYQLEIA